jgi:ABC-type nitrate/sulfonate/bicarbonate transport system ATPase subunit
MDEEFCALDRTPLTAMHASNEIVTKKKRTTFMITPDRIN